MASDPIPGDDDFFCDFSSGAFSSSRFNLCIRRSNEATTIWSGPHDFLTFNLQFVNLLLPALLRVLTMSTEPRMPVHASKQVARGEKPQQVGRRVGAAVHRGTESTVGEQKIEPTAHQAPSSLPKKRSGMP